MESDHHDWPLASLESITSKIGSGATPRGGKQSCKSEGISLIRSLNVYDFEFAYDDLAFPDGDYRDVPGLCKVAPREEIEAQGWSLNPGRYVGIAERETDDIDFQVRLEELNEELETLNAEAHALEEQIAENVAGLLEC